MAKEKVSAQQKKELLALNQKDLTVPMISKLFGKTTSKKDGKFVINEPVYNIRAIMHLDAGEYINKEAVDTTVGSFLFNKLMIEGMIDSIIPNGYYNEVINKKGFKTIIDLISEAVLLKKIPVNPNLITWLKQYEFYGMKLCTIFSPSYSEGLLRQNIEITKRKQELLSSKDINSSVVMTEIEDQLVADSRKILKNDSGMTLFDSGARGSFDNDYKNMNLMVGPVKIPGTDDKFEMMTSNYIEGIKKEELSTAGQIPINSGFPKAKPFRFLVLSLIKS